MKCNMQKSHFKLILLGIKKKKTDCKKLSRNKVDTLAPKQNIDNGINYK